MIILLAESARKPLRPKMKNLEILMMYLNIINLLPVYNY